eukprot:gnl/TRDRNA2_/TRDRNA2_44904_c0_seq1.p1 gnl/TRDRNA2_/TRDRNA2_44904_c0~~gnl/TRDRNA2_/TRDRNA2_44904_c0_seq1.p1  ORF type:complete len:104 (-),score=10.91 gnl/TRDRNA2_/TRDRNA2_44904_c0_seq1:32-343(-)
MWAANAAKVHCKHIQLQLAAREAPKVSCVLRVKWVDGIALMQNSAHGSASVCLHASARKPGAKAGMKQHRMLLRNAPPKEHGGRKCGRSTLQILACSASACCM